MSQVAQRNDKKQSVALLDIPLDHYLVWKWKRRRKKNENPEEVARPLDESPNDPITAIRHLFLVNRPVPFCNPPERHAMKHMTQMRKRLDGEEEEKDKSRKKAIVKKI